VLEGIHAQPEAAAAGCGSRRGVEGEGGPDPAVLPRMILRRQRSRPSIHVSNF